MQILDWNVWNTFFAVIVVIIMILSLSISSWDVDSIYTYWLGGKAQLSREHDLCPSLITKWEEESGVISSMISSISQWMKWKI